MYSLKGFLKESIANAIKFAVQKIDSTAILILDDKTEEIVYNALKQHELSELGISIVVNIKSHRESLNMNPVYILSPGIPSIKLLIQDWKRKTRLKYRKSVHLYINGSIGSQAIELIIGSSLRKYLKTFQEIFCNYQVLESNIFHFEAPEAFRNIYGNLDKSDLYLQEVAERLLSVSVSLGEEPWIRYAKDSPRATKLAMLYKSFWNGKKVKMSRLKTKKKRATLLILDRAQDIVAPLLHEITYQSMVKDLIGHDKESIKIQNLEYDDKDMKSEKELILRFDDDPLWEDFGHMNIAYLQPQIKLKLREFTETYNADKENPDLLEAQKGIQKFIKIAKSCNLHFALSSLLLELYEELHIPNLMEIEQILVTGLNQRDKSVGQRKIQRFLSHLMKSHSLTTKSKLRLFMIYIITRGGITEKQMSDFVKIGEFSDWDQDVIKNLAMFGIDSSSKEQRFKSSKYHAYIQSRAIKLNMTDYVQARYEPLLSLFLKELNDAVLSAHDFPWCADVNFRDTEDSIGDNGFDKSRIIVFVIGGVCWSEVRMCHMLSKELGRHIYLGSSFIASPTQFITLLGGLTPNTEEPDVNSSISASVKQEDWTEESTTEEL